MHGSVLSKYVSNGCPNSDYFNQSKQSFARNKNGYIFPIKKIVEKIEDEEMFLGTIRTDQNTLNQVIYIMTDKNGMITDISSSAISQLNLNIQVISSQCINIDSIIPGAITDSSFTQVQGKMVKICKESLQEKSKAYGFMNQLDKIQLDEKVQQTIEKINQVNQQCYYQCYVC